MTCRIFRLKPQTFQSLSNLIRLGYAQPCILTIYYYRIILNEHEAHMER